MKAIYIYFKLNTKLLLVSLFIVLFMNLSFDVYSQIIHQFNGKQLLEDTHYYLDITTSDTLVISPNTIAVKITEESKESTESYLHGSVGLDKLGELFSWSFFRLPDTINYIQTISNVFNLSEILDLKLDYCLTMPNSIKFRNSNENSSFSFCEGTSLLGNGPWCPDDYELWDFWELSKARVCLDFSIPENERGTDWENERAWYYSTGNPEIIVALVDRGLDMEDDDFVHNDLGYNFMTNSQNVQPDVHDDTEMGTAHASIIGAKISNKNKLAGVSGGDYSDEQNPISGTTLMILKASIDNYTLSGFAAAQSINYAVNNNARIINFPWYSESEENFELVAEALDDANLNDVIVFAPTGDDWNELCSEVWWPAKREDVIAVGATDKNDNRAVWYNWGQIGSRYGDETEISLPGRYVLVRDIYWGGSPGHPPGYFEISSTSIATSLASGIGALMLDVNPCLKQQDVRTLLIESCVKTGGYNYNHDPDKPGHSLELGYGLVDAYEAVKAAVNYPADQLITQNEVWTGTQVKGNIIVKSGTTLTLNNVDLQMYSGKKIIIEPEGKLYVNGGTITNYCNDPWQGIEVWGDYTAHQFPDGNGNYLQGVLVLNGAIIENAISAVELWKPDDYTKTGGIIFANDAVFRNNAKSVHALYYDNYNPINETSVNYNSYFRNCTFEITADYHGEVTFHKHVDLSNVKGFRFEGCDFLLDAAASNVSLYNKGIGAYNAGFSVVAYCTSSTVPCTSYERCTFDGFYDAVYASSPSLPYTFIVSRAIFANNTCGIRINLVNNFSILFSDFHIGQNTTDQDDCDGIGMAASGYGINANASTGFAIEENYFTKASGAPDGYYTGIRMAETHAADQVYRNTFEGLSYGNYAVGKNWYLNYTWQGLAYYCNENTNNWQDFTVEDVPDKDDGIQNPQGSTVMPAGNTFSANANYNFNNWDFNDWIGYYYYAPTQGNTNTVYYPQLVNRVTREEVVGIQNPCLSNYGGGGSSEMNVVMTPEQKQQAELEYAASLSDYSNVKSLFDNLKDGGSTEATLTDIATAWPADMWALRAELLGKSPHLSMDVLKAAADRTEVLPESVIFEIMAANPDELKKEELIKYLEDKDNPLPEYMIDILRQVSMGSSYKTVLLRQMAHYGQLKTRAAHNIVRSLLNDTIADNDELRNWLDNIGGKRADEQIIASYMGEGNFTNALALANMMPALYNYTGEELTEHGYYLDMLNLQISLTQQGKTIFDLDSTEINNLVFLAENSKGTAGIQAKGILEYAYGYHYCNCIGVDNSGYKSSNAFNPVAFEKLLGIEISVEPNPAKEWAVFKYSLPESSAEGVIKISDASGKFITTIPINGKHGQKIWDTREIKSGVYFYTLHVSGFNKSGKIVVSK